MQTTNILKRIPGYDNKMMAEHCESLYRVSLKTKKDKKGKVSRKYDIPSDIVDLIKASIDYYKKVRPFEYRDYQLSIIEQGSSILRVHGFLYLAMEVRTGKTLTSLGIAEELMPKDVLFITKKKAITSIESDYEMMSPNFYMKVVNYESLHLVQDEKNWDIIICDEAHSMGAFPKPSGRAQDVGDLIAKTKARVILLSGTPTPESYSQMYHQVYRIKGNPFERFKNFYRFADEFVNVKQKKINGLLMNDYTRGLDKILEEMSPYTITYTQKQAGFAGEISEEVLEVEMKPSTYALANRLRKDLVVEGKEETILADTPVKLMMKLHQIYSGTVKFESGNSMVLDTSKADFIKEQFEGSKIAIFYKFKEELNALESVFGEKLTTELSVFNDTDCQVIALQIVSGREGISLRKADFLVYYNIDFSATSYWQSRDRMTTKDRTHNKVYWVFSRGGIERDIYKAVIKKKDYTVNHFKNEISLHT